MYKFIGALFVLFIYTVLVVFTNIIVYQYDWTATLIPITVLFACLALINWWGLRAHKIELAYKKVVADSLADELVNGRDELKSSNQEATEYYHKLMDALKEINRLEDKEKQRITLNTPVKSLQKNRTSKVYAMRRVDKVDKSRGDMKYYETEYQLSKGSTWYKRDEIRKVEEIK